MKSKNELWFTREHEWVRAAEDGYVIGISEYAVEQLGDIVYVGLPEVGEVFAVREVFGTVESTKTVSDLYMPISGEVTATNDDLTEKPETVQDDPLTAGWLIKIAPTETVDFSKLMDSGAYQKYVQEEGGVD
ncbi:MAG: glycine cleavage system protein GcvH [Pseudomonadota bacterium]|nr:glycine cleavage system protein GcvH [Pseudomonadota bacterium]